MASNDSGYYTNPTQHAEQQQQPFRRPTGKVVMVGGDVNGPVYEYRPQPQQPQLYYPKDPSGAAVQQQQQQLQYSGGAPPVVYAPANVHPSNGAMSAIPAPQGYQQQQQQQQQQQLPPHAQQLNHHPQAHYQNQGYPPQQISQPNGHFVSMAPPTNYQQQQQLQQHFQQFQHPHDQYNDGWQEQSYYQHHAAGAMRSNDPALLADDFQQMSMQPGYSSGTRTPVSEMPPPRGVPAQHMKASADALRQREQRRENDYDNDDGITGGDIDASLFPASQAQVANLGRSDGYAASANTIQAIGTSAPLVSRGPPQPQPQPPGKHTLTPLQTPPPSSQTSTESLSTATHALNGLPELTCATATSIDIAMHAETDTSTDLACGGDAKSALNSDEDATNVPASNPRLHRRTPIAPNEHCGQKQTVTFGSSGGGVPLRKCSTIYMAQPKLTAKPNNNNAPIKVQFRSTLGSSHCQTQQRHTRRLPLGLSRSSTVSSSLSVDPQQSGKGKHLRRHQPSTASTKHKQAAECDGLDGLKKMKKDQPPSELALQPLTPTLPRWSKFSEKQHQPRPPLRAKANSSHHKSAKQSPPSTTTTKHTAETPKPLTACTKSKSVAHYQNNPALVQVRGPPQPAMSANASVNSIPVMANSAAASPQVLAPGQGPYDNGFDSPSDTRVHLGIRPATSQQNLNVQRGTRVGSGSYDKVSSNFLAASAMYSNADSVDALGGPEPPLQPYAGMRPWTSSSRSLPLGAGQQNLQLPVSERERPSSSASSFTGVVPTANMPSAKAVAPSSPKAPPPTAASLEAYRASVKRSSDTEAQLEFAKYVLEHAKGIADQERNPKLANKRYEVLVGEGLKWVKKLAGGGITVHRSSTAAEAQFFLGTIYSRGIYGVERDDAKAFSYYQQASKSQHAEANYRTAVCYEVGVGIRRDPTRALQFYRKSAAQSNVPAMYKLGLILIKGLLGTAASPREGITWLKRAAENATPECPHGLHELALCHETDDIPGIIQDLSYSRELYIKAGKLGYLPSQVRLGQAYEYGTLGCPIDARKSIGWYTRAAEKNDADAELALSGWYLTGADPFLPQNDVEAYLWARRAADRGLAKAEYAVGYYYECGIGVSQPDLKEAQKWYAKAAQKQNRRAINRLKELRKMGVNGMPASKAARPRRNKGGSMF